VVNHGRPGQRLLIGELCHIVIVAHTEPYLATGDHSAHGGRVRVPLLRADERNARSR
jgi:hypothetical protein